MHRPALNQLSYTGQAHLFIYFLSLRKEWTEYSSLVWSQKKSESNCKTKPGIWIHRLHSPWAIPIPGDQVRSQGICFHHRRLISCPIRAIPDHRLPMRQQQRLCIESALDQCWLGGHRERDQRKTPESTHSLQKAAELDRTAAQLHRMVGKFGLIVHMKFIGSRKLKSEASGRTEK